MDSKESLESKNIIIRIDTKKSWKSASTSETVADQ
jgi:hypothetical protein